MRQGSFKEIFESERGMTLVEILAVVVLISIIMAVVAGGVFEKGDAAKASLNAAHMRNVENYLGQYKLQYGKYPNSLNQLISGPSSNSGIPHVPLAKEGDLKDLFGTDFVYQQGGGGRGFTLKSLGGDGVSGGEGADADVTIKN